MLLTLYIILLIAQFLLTVAVLAFLWQCAVLAVSNGLDVPFIPTPGKLYPRIEEALRIRDGDTMYDVGCGSGAFLLYLAKRHPRARCIGIERNLLLFSYAHLRMRLSGSPANLEYRRGNFYAMEFKDATRIYAFLLPKIMNKLFSETLYPGVRVVSRAFEITSKMPVETIHLAEKSFFGEHLLHIYEL